MSGTSYTFTTFDPATGGQVEVDAINDAGEVVGSYYAPNGAFPADNGFTDISGAISTVDVPGSSSTDITGVNASGMIVGYSFTSDNTVAFVGQPGALTMIAVAGVDVRAAAINASGEVVGTAGADSFTDINGVYSTVSITGAQATQAIGVTAAGVVFGNETDAGGLNHGFLDTAGVFQTIDVPNSQGATSIAGVNASGEIVGVYGAPSGNTEGYADVGGTFTSIAPMGSSYTVVTGVNDAGTVVGYYDGADGNLHGFVDQAGAITSFDPAGSMSTLALGINSSDQVVGSYTDAVTGTQLAFIATPACYCPGALIRTESGDVAVEDLAIGDRVLTVGGTAEPVRWIGRRSYAGRFLRGRPALHPVRVRAGALAEGVPSRDLLVSPEHALLLSGVLVRAADLVNGATIVREAGLERVDYLHVELANHDVIWANDAAAETFVDDDSRGLFSNAAEYAALYPDAARVEAAYCAPRVGQGHELARIRAGLAGRALAA